MNIGSKKTKCKIFYGDNIQGIEYLINTFIKDTNCKIKDIKQTESTGNLTITIFYQENENDKNIQS